MRPKAARSAGLRDLGGTPQSAPTASTMEVAAGAKATAAAEISNLESPSDETAQAALEALQVLPQPDR